MSSNDSEDNQKSVEQNRRWTRSDHCNWNKIEIIIYSISIKNFFRLMRTPVIYLPTIKGWLVIFRLQTMASSPAKTKALLHTVNIYLNKAEISNILMNEELYFRWRLNISKYDLYLNSSDWAPRPCFLLWDCKFDSSTESGCNTLIYIK